jgi:hypothetical protein
LRELHRDSGEYDGLRYVLMTAYESIFYGMPYVSCMVAGVVLLSLVLQKNAIVARSVAFSFQFWIVPFFYLTYMALAQRISASLVVALCLELLFLAVYQVLFRRLFAVVTAITPQQLPQMLNYLRVGIWFILILSVPLYLQSGVGIFSSGSRNEFLQGSRLNLYLVYASALVQCAMTPIVAAIVNTEKRWRASVILYLVLISLLSVLSASKGGVVLTMFAIASLLKFDRPRDSLRVLLIPVCAVATLFTSTVFIVGKFLSLKPWDMVSLMFSRLFLANDGRALAIDWSGYLGHDSASLFRESFRLIATLIGNAPQYPPLGEFLYTLRFGTVGIVGANTSCTALLIAYGSDLEKIFFAFLLAGAALGTALLADISKHGKLPKLAVGIGLLSLLSQDFLAFQVWINILVLMCALVIFKVILTTIVRLAGEPGTLAHKSTAILPQ